MSLKSSEVFHISKLLISVRLSVSPLTHFINLMTIFFFTLLGDLCEAIFKQPPCSQIYKLSLDSKQLSSPKWILNIPLQIAHNFFSDFYFTRLEGFFWTVCPPVTPISTLYVLKIFLDCLPPVTLKQFGQILYNCVQISSLYIPPESVVASCLRVLKLLQK